MNYGELKKQAIHCGAALARGDVLSTLSSLCETQKTISTEKVLEHIERTHEFMRDCAVLMRKLSDQLPSQTTGERCDDCRSVGALHCANPTECGGMKPHANGNQ